MLEVLRFWFTKDLVYIWPWSSEKEDVLKVRQKYIKGKPCKPYNSTLGEFFRVSGAATAPLGTAPLGLRLADDHGVTVQLGGTGQHSGRSQPPRCQRQWQWHHC